MMSYVAKMVSHMQLTSMSQDNSVGIEADYGQLGLDCQLGKIRLFSTESRPVLGPFTRRGRWVKLNTHLHLVPRSRKVELYLKSSYVL
jgi:hypothetical protein